MKKIINPALLLLSIFMLVLSAGCASRSNVKADAPASEEPLVLTDIRLLDNGIVIVSNKQFVYTMYKGNDPYRMTIDIPDMGAGIFRDRIVSDKSGITEVVPQQIDSPNKALKITIALQSPSTVTPVYADNTLTLSVKPEEPVPSVASEELAAGSAKAESAPSAESAPAAGVVSAAVPLSEPAKTPEAVAPSAEKPAEGVIAYIPRATEITAIEVSRVAEGAKVVIAGNGSMMPNVFPIDERIVIDIPGVVMNAAIPTNIASPLKGIRAGRHKEKVRLVLDLREKTKFEVTAIGKSIEVALRGKTIPAAYVAAMKETPGREASKEAQIQESAQAKSTNHREPNGFAAQLMPAPADKEPAKEAGVKDLPADNAVMPEKRYSGKKISLDFQDAEIGPIFRLLADVNGYNLVLDPAIKGKITIKLMNVPWDQALDIILNTFTLGKSIDGNILWIAPRSVFNKIADERSAAKVTQEKTEDLVQEIIRVNYATSADLAAAFTAGKLMSPRGTITQDVRMNTLIIKDTQKSIDKMKELVKVMDVTKPQVMIEAKIVEVSTTHSQNLGIRWGGAMSIRSGAYPVGGTFGVNTPVLTPGPNATTPGGALGMTVGAVNALKVDLSLSALESITKAKTLSSPKILTMDNEQATIQQGTTFYIPTVSQAGTTSTAVTATLSLNVTPKITPDGFVQLKVIATDNSLQPGTAGAEAVVNTKSMTTQALVKNGETLVLGGIYRRDEATTEDGVPFFNKIPGLGWLFKTRTQTGPDVKELLIFITPTIVTQQAENK